MPRDLTFRGGTDDRQGAGAADLDHRARRLRPDRVLTNDELSTLVDTSNEWIMERTGIRERRIAAPEQAFTDLALPAAQAALAQAGVEGEGPRSRCSARP